MQRWKNFKMGLLLATLILTVFLAVAFTAAPFIASIYLLLVQEGEPNLSTLTSSFALPMLRPGALDMLNPAETSAWVLLTWCAVFVAPWLVLIWSWKARDPVAGITRWVTGMSVYVAALATLLITVVAGLAVSLAAL